MSNKHIFFIGLIIILLEATLHQVESSKAAEYGSRRQSFSENIAREYIYLIPEEDITVETDSSDLPTEYTTSSDQATSLPATDDLNMKLVLLPPRTMRATWTTSSYSNLYRFVLTVNGVQNFEDIQRTEFEFRIPAGALVYVVVIALHPETTEASDNNLHSNIFSTESSNSQVYVPWQLLIGDSTSTSLLVEWMAGERVDQLCWKERTSHDSDRACYDVEGNNHLIRNLPSATEFEITLDVGLRNPLVIYTSTNSPGKYRSYAWKCNPGNLCGSVDECFPSTDGLLLPETDPALVSPPTSYPYTCRDLYGDENSLHTNNKNLSSAQTIRREDYPMNIVHADFSDFPDEMDLPFCSLPNALALLTYWCNGKTNCDIEHEHLHSYFIGSQGCQNTNISNFKLNLQNESTMYDEWYCQEGFEIYQPHITCYGIPDESLLDFNTARQNCQAFGGDLTYIFPEIEFLQFVTSISEPLKFWALGAPLEETLIRPPMLFSSIVDKVYAEYSDNNLSVNFCYDECTDITATALCALPPVANIIRRFENKGSTPKDCFPEVCQNGGTCFPVTNSPGLPESDFSFMCRCLDGYSGLQCEINNSLSHELLLEPNNGLYEIPANENGTSIEYVYFGRYNSDGFYGCYAQGALALLRLKCENKMSCSVSQRDLENHLPSTCHPDIPQELRIRISHHQFDTKMDCEYGGELYSDTDTCFALTTNSYENAQEAKLACNDLGGDIAFPYQDLVMCLEGKFSAWADESRQPNSSNFNMIIVQPSILVCGESFEAENIAALCEFPPVPLSSLKTSTSTPMPTTSSTTTTPMPPTLEPITDCPRVKPFPELYPDYYWDSATPGTLTFQKCPNGTDVTGSVVAWFCGYLGEWIDLPDMSKCQTLDLGGWESELNNTNNEDTAGDILTRIAANITSNLSSGDIIGLVTLLGVAQSRHNWDLQNTTGSEEAALNITNKYTDSVTNISSMILEKPSVWAGIPENTRFSTGSQLQENVEAAAVDMSLLLKNQTEIYSYNSLSVLAQQYSFHHYNASKNRIFSHPMYTSSRVSLPEDFYSTLVDKEKVAVTFTAFNTLHCILSKGDVCSENTDDSEFITEELVNSPIIGLTVGNTSWQAPQGSEGLSATFTNFLLDDIFNITNVQCVWWNPKTNVWSPDGCELVSSTKTESKCICDHLTNLAVIVDVNGKLPEFILVITKWITIIGCSISLVCLFFAILTLILLVLKPKHTSRVTSIIHLNFCCCLFASEVVLLAGLDATTPKAGCTFVAILLHYLLLTTFFWMAVESFNVYMLLIKIFSYGKSHLKFYYAFAYGAPVLIVGISLAATKANGYGTKGYCWLDYETGLTWAFAAPALVVLLNNLVIFGLSLKELQQLEVRDTQAGRSVGRGKRTNDQIDRQEERNNKTKMVKVSFTLAMTMGITWLLGFIILFEGMDWIAVIFTIVNSLQGVGLFFALILFPARPRAQFLKLIPYRPNILGKRSFYQKWYPYGRHGEFSEVSSSGNSYYYQGSSDLRWTERLSTMSELSSGNLPTSGGIIIDARRGSGELDICVKRDEDAQRNSTQSYS